jgi:two-component system nitrogen regulation sensor histidine kinase NtrY
MKSNRFNFFVALFAIWIALSSALFFKLAGRTGYTFTTIALAGSWLIGILMLINYVNTTNRNLLVFLKSFRFKDSTIEFNRIGNFPFGSIYNEFNRIINDFKKLKEEKELEHQYFEHVVKHIHTGLIAWNSENHLVLFNETAKKILKTPYIATLGGLVIISKELPELLNHLEPGVNKLIRVNINNEIVPVSLNLMRYKMGESVINLVAMSDLRNELEENESEAWLKLLKILNHEIVNSLSPVKLVSSALLKKIETPTVYQEEFQNIQNDLKEGLSAIQNRSSSLLRFMEDYKAVTDIPKPEIKLELAGELISSLINLLKGSIIGENVKIIIIINPLELPILVDRRLLEQVLINLIKNAVYALQDEPNPIIQVSGYKISDRTVIEIRDNGCGIPFNIIDFIFMPFFTTKKDGSGIGLSWSRQIMKMHKGSIQINSVEKSGTSVKLIF